MMMASVATRRPPCHQQTTPLTWDPMQAMPVTYDLMSPAEDTDMLVALAVALAE
jgi:hypothetical protein